jgi:hypothetical protein
LYASPVTLAAKANEEPDLTKLAFLLEKRQMGHAEDDYLFVLDFSEPNPATAVDRICKRCGTGYLWMYLVFRSSNGGKNSKENASHSRAANAIWLRLRATPYYWGGCKQQSFRHVGKRP